MPAATATASLLNPFPSSWMEPRHWAWPWKLPSWSCRPPTCQDLLKHLSFLKSSAEGPLRSDCCWPCCCCQRRLRRAAEEAPARLHLLRALHGGGGTGQTTVRPQGPCQGLGAPLGGWPGCRMVPCLITERPGRLRLVRDGVLDPSRFSGAPRCWPRGNGGLLDVAVDPDFRAQPVFINLSYAAGERGANGNPGGARSRFQRQSLE